MTMALLQRKCRTLCRYRSLDAAVEDTCNSTNPGPVCRIFFCRYQPKLKFALVLSRDTYPALAPAYAHLQPPAWHHTSLASSNLLHVSTRLSGRGGTWVAPCLAHP